MTEQIYIALFATLSLLAFFILFRASKRIKTEKEALSGHHSDHCSPNNFLFRGPNHGPEKGQSITAEHGKLKNLIENPNVIILELDSSGHILFSNKGAREHFGESDEQLSGKSFFDFCLSETRVAELEAFTAWLTSGSQTYQHECNTRDSSGHISIILWTFSKHSEGDEAFPVIAGIGQDISSLRHTEKELIKANNLYHTTLNAIDEAIASIDPTNHVIISANLAFRHKYGNNIIGRTCHEVTHKIDTPCNVETCSCPIRETLRTGKAAKTEHVHTELDGSTNYLQVNAYPVQEQDGRITQIVHVERDITAHRNIEKRLTEAKHAAEEANRAKSSFLANMSHEIRTPMNAVMGMTGLALELAKDSVQKEYLQTIQTSANVLLGVINDILDFSKIEAGQLVIEETSFKLRRTIEECIKLLRVNAEKKGIGLFSDLPLEAEGEVLGDPLRFRQIITNLVNNAIKFTVAGYVLISAVVLRESDDSIEVEFSVKDTGCGIPPEAREKIFESFQQVDNSSARPHEGTGLGLSIVKKLTNLMDGTITLDSEVKKGSTFSLSLCFKKASARPLALPTPLPLPLSAEGIKTHPILLVDAAGPELRLLTETLQSWDISCTVAATDEEACDLLRKAEEDGSRYSMAIIAQKDFALQDSALLQFMKERKKLPLLRIASLPNEELCENCQQYGIHYCLKTPLVLHELRECIDAVKRGKRCTAVRTEQQEDNDMPTAELPAMRVLLTEDNHFNAMLATALLKKMGQEVMVAGNGLDALHILSKHRFDLILMDVQMPEMDGITTTSIIRRCERENNPRAREHQDLVSALSKKIGGTHTPIVAMTAHAMAGDKERCLHVGMDDYITKPFQPEDLQTVLQKLLAKNEAQNTAENEEGVDPKNGEAKPLSCLQSIQRHLVQNYRIPAKDARHLVVKAQESLQLNLARASSAMQRSDTKLLSMAAHTIKGVLLQIGRPDLATLPSHIENMAREENSVENFALHLKELTSLLSPILTSSLPGESE